MISMARFEQAVLARTYFDANSLHVFDSGTIEGCCLSFHGSESAKSLNVGALCLSGQADSGIANRLLEHAENQSDAGESNRIEVGIVCDSRFGLAGLDPIGHGIGIPSHDFRITSVLAARGYSQVQSVQRMSASVAGYRPPVNRDAVQLRRSTKMNLIGYQHPDERAATAMSHLDIATHQLVDRSGSELARMNLWFSDPEAEVMNPAMAILDLSTAEAVGKLSASESYLIGTVVHSLAARGVSLVETVIDPSQEVLWTEIQSLGFTGGETGSRWVRQL